MAQTAPGKHYRKGLSLVELTRMFPDDASAERWFVETRWPDGVTCPYCDTSERVKARKNRKPMPYYCGACRKYFSVRTGTPIEASNLGLQKWAIAFYLLSTNLKGASSMKLHRDIEVTQKTAWHLAHRIRESWGCDGFPFREKWRYSYGRKCYKKKIPHIRIPLPMISDSRLDEKWIALQFPRPLASYVPQQTSSRITVGYVTLNKVSLASLFDIETGDFNSYGGFTAGNCMIISRSAENNGLAGTSPRQTMRGYFHEEPLPSAR